MNNLSLPAAVPHYRIYQDYCAAYDRLRTRMDHNGNLLKAILQITDPAGQIIVEVAAGTGKLTGLLVPLAQQIYAYDLEPAMVRFACQKFAGTSHVSFDVAGNDAVPLPNKSADLLIEGWSLGYVAFAGGEQWKSAIDRVLAEMERLLKPGGTILLFGTLGTGVHRPSPPNAVLAGLYDYLTAEKGFTQSDWFTTDYCFEDLDEAIALTSFFWSERFGVYVKEHKLINLPECTAIWHKTLPTS